MADSSRNTTHPSSRFECPKCHRTFRDGYNLRQHLKRTRPCAPVLEAEDLPSQAREKPNRCRFCGRAFSRPDAVKRHQKNNCRILKEDEGLEILYDHVLKRSADRLTTAAARIAELEAERAADQRRLDALEARLLAISGEDRAGEGSGLTIDASVRVTNNIAIDVRVANVFGREDTAHIPAEKVRQILSTASADGGHIRASAVAAVCEAALLIYSDPDHPENITCYIPNKRDGTAMVHTAAPDGTRRWEIQPVPLVIPPMAQNSVGLLFDKQPYDGSGDLKEYEAVLAHLRDCEREIVTGPPCESSLRAVLIRNKDLLARVLKALPAAGRPR